MKGYQIDATWDDPYEHLQERRISTRFPFKFRLGITAEDANGRGKVVGPGIVRNLSLSGVLLVTKHVLTPFQRVHLEIPTAGCSDTVCLPEMFEGGAMVLRVRELDRGRIDAALRFGDEFAQNMEFAMFIDLLQAMARVMVTSPRVA